MMHTTRPQAEPAPAETSTARPTVLVTGSSGLIGARLCRALAPDHDVVGLDRDPPGEGADRGSLSLFLECDLTDDASVEEAFRRLVDERGDRLASVVHLAAYYDFSGEPSPLYEELTVEGTRRVLRALQALRTEQFVFTSSVLVLRPAPPGEVLDESSPLEAEWEYPRSKLQAERAIEESRGSIPTVVLRIAGVYDDACDSIPLAQQIRRILERKLESHLFPGDLHHAQSYVHLEDLVQCLRAVVERRGDLGPSELFVIGEEDAMTFGELQDRIGEALHGRAWTTLEIPPALAKAGAWMKDKVAGREPFIKPWMIDLADANLPVSIAHARETLGWSTSRRLRDTLPKMIDGLLADPRAWYERHGIEPPGDLDALLERRRTHASPSDRERASR